MIEDFVMSFMYQDASKMTLKVMFVFDTSPKGSLYVNLYSEDQLINSSSETTLDENQSKKLFYFAGFVLFFIILLVVHCTL